MDKNITKEMKKLLEDLADLTEKASNEVYDDGEENGTGGILKICDLLVNKIDEYLEK